MVAGIGSGKFLLGFFDSEMPSSQNCRYKDMGYDFCEFNEQEIFRKFLDMFIRPKSDLRGDEPAYKDEVSNDQ